jgi:hypothetical protein
MTKWLCLALGLLAAPAAAQDMLDFQAPSGNIFCLMIAGPDGGARCDMRELTPSFKTPPADCDLDYGSFFWIGATGPAYPACAGDTVMNPRAPVLDYGKAVKLGKVTCSAEKSGVTCKNAEGHGFTLSRAKQKVF